jgi:hypothetical protein
VTAFDGSELDDFREDRPERDESEPGLDVVRCKHCDGWIVPTEFGGWGDWNAPDLVLCEDPEYPEFPTQRHEPAEEVTE